MNMMKRCLLLFVLFFSLLACTSKSEVDDLAMESAKARMKTKIIQEIEQSVQGKEGLKKTYVDVIMQHSQFETEKSTVKDQSAKVMVRVKTVPLVVREKLMGVIEKIDEWKDSRFNMSDALGLVRTEIKNDQLSDERFLIELKKGSQWKVVD